MQIKATIFINFDLRLTVLNYGQNNAQNNSFMMMQK